MMNERHGLGTHPVLVSPFVGVTANFTFSEDCSRLDGTIDFIGDFDNEEFLVSIRIVDTIDT